MTAIPLEMTSPYCLAELARLAQLKARARHASPKDSFLVTPANSSSESSADADPVAVQPLSDTDLKLAQTKLFMRGSSFPKQHQYPEGRSEEVVRRVLGAQSPRCVTQLPDQVGSGSLPGNAPIIDHLFVRVAASPDWHELTPAIELLRQHRCPNLEALPLVQEITLGKSSDAEVLAAKDFFRTQVKETEEKFMICPLAVDVRSIRVAEGSSFTVTNDEVKPLSFRIVGGSEEAAELMPVRLIVGHIGWQLHVRLPWDLSVDEGHSLLSMSPMELQPQAATLFKELERLVGIHNMQMDLRKFFMIIEVTFRQNIWEDSIHQPLELDVLARFAGYNMLNASFVALNWISLGTILPSEKQCGGGDGRWLEPWEELPLPLQVRFCFGCLLFKTVSVPVPSSFS